MTTDRERFEQWAREYEEDLDLRGSVEPHGFEYVSDRAHDLYAAWTSSRLYDAAAAPCQECERLREDVETVVDWIVGWWPGLEGGMSWPDNDDHPVHVAAQRIQAALAQPGPAAAKEE
jgi:hypothetical protein